MNSELRMPKEFQFIGDILIMVTFTHLTETLIKQIDSFHRETQKPKETVTTLPVTHYWLLVTKSRWRIQNILISKMEDLFLCSDIQYI